MRTCVSGPSWLIRVGWMCYSRSGILHGLNVRMCSGPRVFNAGETCIPGVNIKRDFTTGPSITSETVLHFFALYIFLTLTWKSIAIKILADLLVTLLLPISTKVTYILSRIETNVFCLFNPVIG